MSAIHGLNPAPERPPKPVTPKAAPRVEVPKKPSSWRVWVLLAIVAGGAWAAYEFRGRPNTQTPEGAGVRTAKVTTGPIQRVLRLTGSTSAKNFAMVSAPMMRGPDAGRALVLIYVAKSGGLVKKGEVVAEIDAQSTKDHVDD